MLFAQRSSSSYYGDSKLRTIVLQTRFFWHKNTTTGGRILANSTSMRFHTPFLIILSKLNRTIHTESCDGALHSCGEQILHYTSGRSMVLHRNWYTSSHTLFCTVRTEIVPHCASDDTISVHAQRWHWHKFLQYLANENQWPAATPLLLHPSIGLWTANSCIIS